MRKFARIKLRRDWSEMSTERSFCSNKRTLHCNIFNVFQNDVTLIDKLNYQRIKEPILKFYWSFEFWAYSKQTCFFKYIILFNEDTTPPPPIFTTQWLYTSNFFSNMYSWYTVYSYMKILWIGLSTFEFNSQSTKLPLILNSNIHNYTTEFAFLF